MLYNHAETFAGKRVRAWNPGDAPIEPAGEVPRLTIDYDAQYSWPDLLEEFLATPSAGQIEGIVVGAWFGEHVEDATPAARSVEALVGAREHLRSLRAIFFGDITTEESELSWIQNTDVSPVLIAFGEELDEFRVRGGQGLELGSSVSLPSLRKLVIETGGLDAGIVRQVSGAALPALEHLELWIGEDNYGRTTTADDVAALLAAGAWPELRYLGLRNAEIADELVPVVVSSPVFEQLAVLDLSLGTLSDVGGEALLEAGISGLAKLDIHRHYCSDDVVKRLVAAVREVDASDVQKEDKYGRFVFVGE